MSQHTPGPWTFDGKYIYADETPLVRLHPGAPNFEASARLIAAAPDLLEACQMYMSMQTRECANCRDDEDGICGEHTSESYRTLEAIEAAIAKATGETK